MTSLASLPPELLLHIVSMLAEELPPSKRFLHEEPSDLILSSDQRPLKNLSLTCRLLHDLCVPYLFHALKANAEELAGLLSFIRAHNLPRNVAKLMIWSNKPQYGTSAAGPDCQQPVLVFGEVTALLDAFQPKSITFMLPPATFRCIVPYDFHIGDAWAFDLKYQILHLEQTPDPMQRVSLAKQTQNSNIFTLRPWTHMTFNEGSSIPAYSSYEYFRKNMPSPLDGYRCLFSGAWSSLVTLEIVAVFPISLSKFSICVNTMSSLQCLRTQLAPVDNRIMDDAEGLGKCQRSDLWLEFEGAYHSLARLIAKDQNPRLFKFWKFVSLDYAQHNLRGMIDRAVQIEEWGWRHDNAGIWTKL